MPFISLSTLSIRPRQRELDDKALGPLKDSIKSKGLMHAPVIGTDGDGAFLLVGHHRTEAMRQLHEAEVKFLYDGIEVPVGTIPVTNIFDLSAADYAEAELEENIIRVEISWQDRARALAAIHALRVAANPAHTFTDTAKELAEKSGQATAPSGRQRVEIRNASILAQNLHRPSVSKARNATEALGILYKEEEAKVEAELIRRKHSAMGAITTSQIEVRHGDFTSILPTLSAGTFDLIIADLPYGIDADKGGFRQRTVEHHNYEDSPETAKALLQALISEGFRVCKPRANLFIFGDVDLFPLFKQASGAMGWTVFRTPIIWRKSESEGLAPWGREGFRRTYEMLFFATKGKRGLSQSPVDILDESRVARHKRRYGPEKPVGLMEQLIECSTMPGDYVLDPCCGAGSTLIAARHLKRKALGIELAESAYNMSVVAADHDPHEPETEQPKAEELA